MSDQRFEPGCEIRCPCCGNPFDTDDHIPACVTPASLALYGAAPDLLAIAKRVAEHFADTDAPLGIDARAAIAKAEGRVS